MPTLSSLLVQHGAASMRAVEDAIARQVFHGGDLATNLLELGAVREEALLKVLAETYGLEAALTGPLTPPSQEVLRLLPADLASRHGLFPMKLLDRALVVAVSQPLLPTVEDDLGFALDLSLRQVITTQVRIRQAIAGCYGIPLDRRLLRLQARLDGYPDPSPSAAPPPGRDLLAVRMPEALSIPVPSFSSGLPDSERAPARLMAMPAPKAPFVDTPQDLVNPAIPRSPRSPTSPMIPILTPEGLPPSEKQATLEETPPSGAVIAAPPIVTKPWSPPAVDASEQPAALPVSSDRKSAAPVADTMRGPEPSPETPRPEALKPRISTRAIADTLRDAIRDGQAVDKRRSATWRLSERRRKKGPVTSASAEEDLEAAATTDDVLEVLFAFARQFFEYTALFFVHGDVAEGKDASGPGADGATVSTIDVPLDQPSHLATARARSAPVIARPASGLDSALARELKRDREALRAVALLPIVVRSRTVAILWGDDGEADVDLGALGDVVAVTALGGAALERIALKKKRSARTEAVEAPRPAAEGDVARPMKREGVAALARSVSGTHATLGPARASAPPVAPPVDHPPKTPPPPALRERSGAYGTPRTAEAMAEQRELVQRVIEGGLEGRAAFEELVRTGEHAVQVIMARFPGPLRVDRHRARGELPLASQCGPILELVVMLNRVALPFVSVRSSAQDTEVRFWATHTLGELRFPEAATVLLPRLFDDDAPVRRIARRSAASLVGAGSAGAPILKGLEDITRNPDEPKVHRMVAIETMGEIRSGSLVPPLLDAIRDGSDDIAEAARRALLIITRQDFGRDAAGWRAWWLENNGRHRVEWLIDALMHEQPSVRRAAGDELKLSTKEYFGYYDDLPRRDRERAQGLYRSWWDREGKRRFSA